MLIATVCQRSAEVLIHFFLRPGSTQTEVTSDPMYSKENEAGMVSWLFLTVSLTTSEMIQKWRAHL